MRFPGCLRSQVLTRLRGAQVNRSSVACGIGIVAVLVSAFKDLVRIEYPAEWAPHSRCYNVRGYPILGLMANGRSTEDSLWIQQTYVPIISNTLLFTLRTKRPALYYPNSCRPYLGLSSDSARANLSAHSIRVFESPSFRFTKDFF